MSFNDIKNDIKNYFLKNSDNVKKSNAANNSKNETKSAEKRDKPFMHFAENERKGNINYSVNDILNDAYKHPNSTDSDVKTKARKGDEVTTKSMNEANGLDDEKDKNEVKSDSNTDSRGKIYNEDGSYNKEVIKELAKEMSFDELAEYTGAEIIEHNNNSRELNFDGFHILQSGIDADLGKATKLKEEIFNEDGSINAERTGELFESGELTVWDFDDVFGATITRSETASVTLEDGTEIAVSDQRWSGMSDAAELIIKLPNGEELYFEQRDKE